MRALLVPVALLFLVFATTSCERLNKQVPGTGELVEIQLTDLSGIPGEYGELVDITTHAAYPGWAQLWFEDENKTIRVVRVEFVAKRMHAYVAEIPRN